MKKITISAFDLLCIVAGFFCCFTVPAHGQNKPAAVTEKDYAAYLFVYFTGNQQAEEAVHYAVSADGYHYFALNNNRPVLHSKRISSTGGVRDPHILRGEDGKTFYMVLTDMVSAQGWNSNRAMVLLKSTDLIHWSSTVVNIQKQYAHQADLQRVWAPQTIFDPKEGKYMIYWSMKHGEDPDKIYYAYANADFTGLEGEPKQLFFPENGKSCIDGDIIRKDSLFYLFYKTEGHGNGIKVATSTSLTSGQWQESANYKQQTTDAVEGSCVFKLIGTDTYVLMYDVYGKGRYQFTKSTDLAHFSVIDSEVSMDFHPRHGTVIPITRSEWKTLTNKWGIPSNYPIATIKNNPVLEGYYADPEVLYAQKTKKFYLYPTSDGFDGWGGYYFKSFSSDNLVDWKDEGILLDLKKDVPWAGRNAWAPAIEEKKINGKYRYFYYYSGAQKIGVAVGDEPTGPFRDIGKPLIASKPRGIQRGQEIDPDVFTDPKTGKSYLYWGNGYMAVAELNADMVSIKENTLKVITPDQTFREGTYVFYRKGTYYFLWSENDTRSPDYRVRYGTAKSPVGPIQVPANNLILAKNARQGIFGTGHNSVLQIPGKDEWYIVYHRFSYPDGIHMGDAAGYHREVCIDRLTFNADGSIQPTIPTLQGMKPLLPTATWSETQAPKDIYAFAYFKGNGEDGLHLAYSLDGYRWEVLKQDQSFLKPELSKDKLMRDPCIIRGGDGLFHMVWTVSWTDKGIGHASSKDLIHWSTQQYIPVMAHEINARNCWAPEITYNPQEKNYLIYWATTIKGKFPETQIEADNGYNHRIYSITTKDFEHFSEAKLLYDPGFNVIDASIKWNGKEWMMFLKDETKEPVQKNLKIAYAKQLEGPYAPASAPITGNYWAEGPTVTHLDKHWIVYFDKYRDHKYGAIQSTDLKQWQDVSDKLVLPPGIRHGTVFKINKAELERLKAVH